MGWPAVTPCSRWTYSRGGAERWKPSPQRRLNRGSHDPGQDVPRFEGRRGLSGLSHSGRGHHKMAGLSLGAMHRVWRKGGGDAPMDCRANTYVLPSLWRGRHAHHLPHFDWAWRACRWSRVHRAPKVITRSVLANRYCGYLLPHLGRHHQYWADDHRGRHEIGAGLHV